MTRTIIGLEEEEQKWLTEESRRTGMSRAAIVRISIRAMRGDREKSFEDLLKRTSGTWKEGDALEYQNRLRSEWD